MLKKCIIITGMHRSGTSALAGVVEALGVNFGENLLPPQADNPKGFFESRELVEINNSLLEYLDSSWNDLKNENYSFSQDAFESSKLNSLLNEAINFLNTFINKEDVFGLKDPRFCLTLPFWETIFAELGITPVYLISIRNPFEVSASLLKRNGFRQFDSLLLYGKYMFNLERNTKKAIRYFVDFDALVEKPEMVLDRVLEFFSENGLNVVASEESLAFIKNSFLDSNLKHHSVRAEEKKLTPHLFNEIHSRFYQKTKTTSSEIKTQKEFSVLEKEYLALLTAIPAICYYKTQQHGTFSESRKLIMPVQLSKDKQTICFDFTILKDKVTDLRLDLTERVSIVKIDQIALIRDRYNKIITFLSNASLVAGDVLVFTTNDPNIFLDFPSDVDDFQQLVVSFQLLEYTKEGIIDKLIQDNLTHMKKLESKNKLVDDLKTHLAETEARYASALESKEALLAETERQYQELNKELLIVKQYYSKLKESWSSRLGFGLTAPFRWFYEFFKLQRLHGKLKLFIKIMTIGLLKPKTALAVFNKRNIKTLLNALGNESIETIGRNLDKLTNDTELIINSGKRSLDNNIIFNIDEIGYTTKSFIIKGWVISPNGIEKVEVWLKDSVMSINNFESRPDVGHIYPNIPESDCCGFYLSRTVESKIDQVKVIFFDKVGNKIETVHLVEEIKDYSQLSLNEQYQVFMKKNERIEDQIAIERECKQFSYQPKFSIIVPVYNVSPKWLDLCIESVVNQYYENWDLCLYDDASTNEDTVNCLRNWKGKDKRIKIRFGTDNKGISIASNEAIKLADGDFVGLLDHDDELSTNALYEIVKVLNKNPKLDLIYSDEDKLEIGGRRVEPHFKSDFNLDLIRSNNYICHFTVIRRLVGETVGWFKQGFEGSQDHDLILRVIDIISPVNIYHIPKILYHWRKIVGSTASSYGDKSYVSLAGKRAIEEHLKRNKIKGLVEEKGRGLYRVRYHVEKENLISVIIPFKDEVELLKKCIDSILLNTMYRNYEILLISNNSEEKKTKKYLEFITDRNSHISLFEYNIPFNYSKINNWAVTKAKGDYILLLNNDIEVNSKGWLTSMVELLQRKEVGAVGAKLLYEDGTVQHGGVIIGLGGVAGHAHKHFPSNVPGYFYRLSIIQNLSACTAACLMVKKELFKEIEGFDENNLKIAFNDIDLCLKIRKLGFLITYTPYAELYHFESKSRGFEDTPEKLERFKKEIAFFKNKWERELKCGDPYYNVNLTLDREDFSLKLK